MSDTNRTPIMSKSETRVVGDIPNAIAGFERPENSIRRLRDGRASEGDLGLIVQWVACLEGLIAISIQKPTWHVFDKDDEDTWPETSVHAWVFDGMSRIALWSVARTWVINGTVPLDVTHWQPIVIPESPQ